MEVSCFGKRGTGSTLTRPAWLEGQLQTVGRQPREEAARLLAAHPEEAPAGKLRGTPLTGAAPSRPGALGLVSGSQTRKQGQGS